MTGIFSLGGGVAALGIATDHGSGIFEGAQHTGHVLQWRKLGATLCQRPRRLSFEVDEIGIALYHQYLPKMQVAMHTGTQTADRITGKPFHFSEQPVAQAKQLLHFSCSLAAQAVTTGCQHIQRTPDLLTNTRRPAVAVGL